MNDMSKYGYNDWRNYLMHYNHNHDALGRFTTSTGGIVTLKKEISKPKSAINTIRNTIDKKTKGYSIHETNKSIREYNKWADNINKTTTRVRFKYKGHDVEANYNNTVYTKKQALSIIKKTPSYDRSVRNDPMFKATTRELSQWGSNNGKLKDHHLEFIKINDKDPNVLDMSYYSEDFGGHSQTVEYDRKRKKVYDVSFDG